MSVLVAKTLVEVASLYLMIFHKSPLLEVGDDKTSQGKPCFGQDLRVVDETAIPVSVFAVASAIYVQCLRPSAFSDYSYRSFGRAHGIARLFLSRDTQAFDVSVPGVTHLHTFLQIWEDHS